MSQDPHSAAYFGESRDYWWNRDFLELMARRWRLAEVGRALDVGCGQGHWGRCLAPFLAPGCELVGVDREERSLAEARRRSSAFPQVRWTFADAAVEQLPFPDGSFDFVTCQTVLIHVADPMAALREMVRVLRPGGLLGLVEPRNLSINLVPDDLGADAAELSALMEFQLRCEQGKMRLGEGFNSVGPLLPGYLAALCLESVESFQSDKTVMLLPGIEAPESRAVLGDASVFAAKGQWIWDREQTLRYFLAGGGDPRAFVSSWTRVLEREAQQLRAIKERRLALTTAPTCLLVSARKPVF